MPPAISSTESEGAIASLQPGNPEAVMRRFIGEVINNGDYSALRDLIHPDYVYRTPGQELRGPQQIEDLFELYRAAFPDLHVQINDLVAAADKIAITITLTATHAGSLTGIDATGRRVKIRGSVFSRFAGGRIVEEWELLDQLSLLEQLGVASLPG